MMELDYVFHIEGQLPQAFFYFQRKKIAALQAALDQSKKPYRIERKRI